MHRYFICLLSEPAYLFFREPVFVQYLKDLYLRADDPSILVQHTLYSRAIIKFIYIQNQVRNVEKCKSPGNAGK